MGATELQIRTIKILISIYRIYLSTRICFLFFFLDYAGSIISLCNKYYFKLGQKKLFIVTNWILNFAVNCKNQECTNASVLRTRYYLKYSATLLCYGT